MSRIARALALGSLAVALPAAAALVPDRTLPTPGAVTALGVTHRSVVFAVAESKQSCAYVELWSTSTQRRWRFARYPTLCREAPSTGTGIAAVATSGARVFWLSFAGGNIREWDLSTATPTRRSPRHVVSVSADADDGEVPILLGPGTRDGVPYAVGGTVTYVSDNGARLFRTTLDSPVRLIAGGSGPGGGRVVAALEDGRVVVLSRLGEVVSDEAHAGVQPVAIALSASGPVVQIGREVTVGSLANAVRTTLPPGARLLDVRQEELVYAVGPKVRVRVVATGDDTLLQTIAIGPRERPLFATDTGGSAWARGASVSWRAGPLSS